MAEPKILITEEEFRNFMYEMASHSPIARAICDRWWSEELTRSSDIETEQRRIDDEAAAAKAATAAPPAEAKIFSIATPGGALVVTPPLERPAWWPSAAPWPPTPPAA
jgi:hypothetical protein